MAVAACFATLATAVVVAVVFEQAAVAVGATVRAACGAMLR